MAPYFQGQLEIKPCDKINAAPPDAEAQANAFVQAALGGAPEMRQIETMIRVAVAQAFRQQRVEVPQGASVSAAVTPFLYASELPAHAFEALALGLVQHRPRAELVELLGAEAPAVLELVEHPQRWPIGFFACTEELRGADGSAAQSQLVPYVASACTLGCCLHVPAALSAALQGAQAQRWHRERPGRLLVGAQTVWRALASDHELDDTTRRWIQEHPDCLVATVFDAQAASSYLIAEPFQV